MLWKTHRRITEKVCSELGLPDWATDRLVEGVLVPDKWGDYPHHHGKSGTIMQCLLEARRLFLSDLSSAYYNLGVAFHYIQDAHTSFAWRSRDSAKGQEWHNKYKQWVDDAYFTNDVEKLVRTAFREDRKQMEFCLNILGLLSYRIEGKKDTLDLATSNLGKNPNWDSEWGKPAVDLNLAFQVCLTTAKSVLGSKTNMGIQEELSKVLREYELKLKEREYDSAKKIIGLIRKRDEARKAKGFLSFFWTTIISRIFDSWAKSNFRKYEARNHLAKIAKTYNQAAKSIARPYMDWYSITIPPININTAEKKLLSIPEALTHVNIDEATLRNTLQERKLIYNLVSMELVQKSDLEELWHI